MSYISSFSLFRPLFALSVVLISFTIGRAVPQDDAGMGAVAVDSSEVSAISLDGNNSPAVTMQAAAIATSAPESSASLQLASFPLRPVFDNSIRFRDNKNYTDVDAPIVTFFRNSSNLTTYHIEDTEVFNRSLRNDTFLL